MLRRIKREWAYTAVPVILLTCFFSYEKIVAAKQLVVAEESPLANVDTQAGDGILKDTRSIAKAIESRSLGKLSRQQVNRMASHILMLSKRYEFSPALILSLIDVESRFQPNAVSDQGAMGLMQLKPETAHAIAEKLGIPWFGEESLLDPRLNLEMALHYLQELRRKFKTPQYYLVAYNQGPERLNQIIRSGQPLPDRYYNKVIKSYRSYHSGVY